VIAVLSPAGASQRGVILHRAMHPLGTIVDPCDWPCAAVIDDARLTPDRTWGAALDDDVLDEVRTAIRDACEQALRGLVQPRPDMRALHILGAGFELPSALAARGVRVRGALWLGDHAGVDVITARGAPRHVIPSVPIEGAIVAFLSGVSPGELVEALARAVFPELTFTDSRRGAPDVPVPLPGLPPVAPKRRDPTLAEVVQTRLIDLGVGFGVSAVVLDPVATPIVRHADGVLWIARDAPALANLSPTDRVAVDALVAHCVTVLHAELADFTDVQESIAIGALLANGADYFAHE
jgi:hypothetical protein